MAKTFSVAKRQGVCWKLCFIADSEAAFNRNILSLIEDAVEGGSTLIQLRGKKWTTRKFLEVACLAHKFLSPRGIPLIINDRIDIALASGAEGVHLGQEDMPLLHARDILGKKKLIGISVNTPEEAKAAEAEGGDYVGAGPVFPTESKKNLRSFLGSKGLEEIRRTITIPILAIGGINETNIREVMKTGADGVALISAITDARDIKAATKKLRNLLA